MLAANTTWRAFIGYRSSWCVDAAAPTRTQPPLRGRRRRAAPAGAPGWSTWRIELVPLAHRVGPPGAPGWTPF
eukprot:619001-Prorocentrum_minimum.AAC.1